MLSITQNSQPLKAYLAYSDMEGMMDLVEDAMATVTYNILGTYEF